MLTVINKIGYKKNKVIYNKNKYVDFIDDLDPIILKRGSILESSQEEAVSLSRYGMILYESLSIADDIVKSPCEWFKYFQKRYCILSTHPYVYTEIVNRVKFKFYNNLINDVFVANDDNDMRNMIYVCTLIGHIHHREYIDTFGRDLEFIDIMFK